MTRHRMSLRAATMEALEILETPLMTLYNTEGHIAIYDQDGHTSVNVWHCPVLRKEGCTEIHSHQYHGCSTLLAGSLLDEQYDLGDDGEPIELVKMMPGEWKALGTIHGRATRVETTHSRGDSYCIPYDRLHRAITPGLAVTLFRRTEVNRAVPIKMQIGGKLGTGGLIMNPGGDLARWFPEINLATRALLAGEDRGDELETLLRGASTSVDAYLAGP